MARRRISKSRDNARHALVGGWTQRRGKFVHLLLGIREGRRQKLRFVAEIEMPADRLAMTFLEDQLRAAESENSPFDGDISSSASVTRHWIVPDLVADVDFSGWTGSHTLRDPSLNWVTQRSAVRHPQWLKPPE